MPMRKITPLPLLLCSSQAKNKLQVEFSLFSSHGREDWSLDNEDLEWFMQPASMIVYIADVFSSLRLYSGEEDGTESYLGKRRNHMLLILAQSDYE